MNQPIHVLLIEKSPDDARWVEAELRAAPSRVVFQLTWLDRLDKALEHLASNDTHAVLVDLTSPESDGLDALQRVLACAPQLPVIVMTGQADEELALKALQLGVQDHLIKGEVDGRLLARVVQNAIQRKQTEIQLADALEFNQHIVTSSPVGIFTYRLSGRCLSANAAAAQMVGTTVEQLLAQNFHQIESWKRSGLYKMALQTISTGLPTVGDVHVLTSFGRNAWYTAHFVLFRSQGEDLLMMMFSDITERKQAEESLRDSEVRYRTLMEKSLEAIYVYDMESKGVVAANPAFLNLLGYREEEAAQLTLYDILAHDRESIDSLLVQIQTEGATALGERLWRRKDGTTVLVEVTGNKIQQAARDLIFVVGRDITERKRADAALREKEHLLSESQHIGRIGSWSYDILDDSLKFSDEMYQLLDILPDEFHHNSGDFLTLIYPSDRSVAAQWMTDMKEGRQAKDLDFRIFRKNGELCYLHCGGAVESDENGKPARFIGTVQDVTERRLADIQIKQQIKRLTALSEIDRAILSSFDQKHILRVILSHVISELQVDAAAVLLLDSEGTTLRFVAGQGFRTGTIEATQLRIGESQAGQAAKQRRMVRIPDVREMTIDLAFHTIVKAEGFIGYMSVPLIVKGKVKGVLEVFQRTPLQPYQEWLDFFNTLAGQTAIAIENSSLFGTLEATNQELLQAYDATIEGWSRAMDLRDRETAGHTQRVTQLSLELARAMGIDSSRLVHIRRGALLHDIGKLGVPDHILFKPGQLTEEERAIMQQHTDLAYDMLSPIHYLKPALAIPYFHHEHWDGTGYPLGLKGEQIPLEARIFAIVDVWDALQSDRPYRKAFTRQETIDYIHSNAGKHFDPRLVERFLQIVKD